MMRWYLVLVAIFSSILSIAQNLQWANKIIQVSSELTKNQFSANQALGKPDVLPAGGNNPNAWVPSKPKRAEYIKVGFASALNVRQIAIAESFNPSALKRILLYDETGKEYEVSVLNPRPIPLIARMLNVFIELTPYKVTAVKLEFDGSVLSDYFGIDAVGITDSSYPVIAQVDESTLFASGLVIEALDKNINSDVKEYNPILSPDGKTLYFSRRNYSGNIGGVSDKEDIWYSELGADGKWSLAKNLGPQFNNDYPNFISSIANVSPDGKSAIMILGNKYLEDGKRMQAGVSISQKKNGVWTKPKPINITNDYNYNNQANYFLADDMKTMMLSVQRDDSYGDRDIYVSFMDKDSVWSEPLNLGRVVNTKAEESSPFLAMDNKTLYFSSNGFSGFGGSDIYISKRLDDTWTNWSPPENMGKIINSKEDDLFFNIPANSEYAYYSRGVSTHNADIYRVKLPEMNNPYPWVNVKGKLLNSKTNQPVSAKIIVQELPGGKDVSTTKSDSLTGEYNIKVQGGKQYSIRAEAKDYISESQQLDLSKTKSDKTKEETNINVDVRPINLVPIEKGAVVRLNNIFFDFDRATLRDTSFPELDRVVALLNDRSTLTIEVGGHTDNKGSDQYNQVLSEKRAQAVKKYISDKGIDAKRITAIGYGELKPVASNNEEKNGRELNRRVEFKILKD